MNFRFKRSWINRYTIIGLFFIIWMLFFDTNSVVTHFKLNAQLNKLENQKHYLDSMVVVEQTEFEKIKSSARVQEKIAREKYWMTKDNEDLFIIIPKDTL